MLTIDPLLASSLSRSLRDPRKITVIAHDRIGSSSRPRPIPEGFGPESHPITGELSMKPLNPQVIANPIAVADCVLKSLPTMAIVVGKTGYGRVDWDRTASRCRGGREGN